MFTLHPETPGDEWEVEALFDSAFGPGRFALSSYSLRSGVGPVRRLSAVARDDFGTLCGSIRFWPVKAGLADALLLGPVAVHPTRQGEGLGGILIRAGIARAREIGWQDILLVGDEPYYRRFGFSRAAGVAFPPPTDPDRVLHLKLDAEARPAISGRVSKWTGPVRD